jgi:hypothetical protein
MSIKNALIVFAAFFTLMASAIVIILLLQGDTKSALSVAAAYGGTAIGITFLGYMIYADMHS